MILLSLLGCDAGENFAEGCAGLSADDCAIHTECAVIQGAPLDWADPIACYTLGDAVPVGCQDADTTCPPAIAYGSRVDGSCFEFAAGCVPEGWSACEGDPAAVGECP